MSDPFWDAMAPNEELDRDDEAINRALRWRVIEQHLVTHVDGSAMLAQAATRAAAEALFRRAGLLAVAQRR